MSRIPRLENMSSPETSHSDSEDIAEALFQHDMQQLRSEDSLDSKLNLLDIGFSYANRDAAFQQYKLDNDGDERFAPPYMNDEEGLFYRIAVPGLTAYIYRWWPWLPIEKWLIRKVLNQDTYVSNPCWLQVTCPRILARLQPPGLPQ